MYINFHSAITESEGDANEISIFTYNLKHVSTLCIYCMHQLVVTDLQA
jgi:hypothetical protein